MIKERDSIEPKGLRGHRVTNGLSSTWLQRLMLLLRHGRWTTFFPDTLHDESERTPSNRLSEFVLGAFVHIAWSASPSPVDTGNDTKHKISNNNLLSTLSTHCTRVGATKDCGAHDEIAKTVCATSQSPTTCSASKDAYNGHATICAGRVLTIQTTLQ